MLFYIIFLTQRNEPLKWNLTLSYFFSAIFWFFLSSRVSQTIFIDKHSPVYDTFVSNIIYIFKIYLTTLTFPKATAHFIFIWSIREIKKSADISIIIRTLMSISNAKLSIKLCYFYLLNIYSASSFVLCWPTGHLSVSLHSITFSFLGIPIRPQANRHGRTKSEAAALVAKGPSLSHTCCKPMAQCQLRSVSPPGTLPWQQLPRWQHVRACPLKSTGGWRRTRRYIWPVPATGGNGHQNHTNATSRRWDPKPL